MKKAKRRKGRYSGFLLLAVSVCFVILPLLLMGAASFMAGDELAFRYLEALGLGKGPVRPALLPDYPTIAPYRELFLHSPGFFVMFWNSCLQVFGILAGQLLAGMPAAWAFARFRFPGKRILFLLYLLLMIMPFQVMMAPSYLILERLGLLDTHLAILVPGIFSTFPVYIMERFFESIPNSLLEAAYIDGAGEWTAFVRVGFFEYWSALEQPLTFLKDKTLWPLSLYLPNVTADKASVAFAAGAVAILLPALLYLNGQTWLEQGIYASGIKE